jgi:S-adenosylmethionine decarboxylase
MQSKLKLYGFNNLTKSLSFNIYDVCYAKSPREQRDYIAYIDEQYNSERLTKILFHVTKMIGAHVLNVSKQDYEPQGASVTFLIAESNMIPAGQKSAASAALSYQESLLPSNKDGKINNGSDGRNDKQSCEQKDAYNYCNCDCYGNDELVAHLDKSHITVHTYPEYHPETNIATFRVDIDVATCGEITPLSTLDFLIGSFDSDIITMDYRVRGFTRNVEGKKIFIDHTITSIQDYIDKVTLDKYDAIDINMYPIQRC